MHGLPNLKIPTYIAKVNGFRSDIRNLAAVVIFMAPCTKIKYTKMTNKMQLCRIIYCSLAALLVSSDTFARHQEHQSIIPKVVYTV